MKKAGLHGMDAPLLIEFTRLESGLGIVEWGAPEAQEVFILRLGAILAANAKYHP